MVSVDPGLFDTAPDTRDSGADHAPCSCHEMNEHIAADLGELEREVLRLVWKLGPVTAETMSERVEAITRAANVEAFMPWSETVTQ